MSYHRRIIAPALMALAAHAIMAEDKPNVIVDEFYGLEDDAKSGNRTGKSTKAEKKLMKRLRTASRTQTTKPVEIDLPEFVQIATDKPLTKDQWALLNADPSSLIAQAIGGISGSITNGTINTSPLSKDTLVPRSEPRTYEEGRTAMNPLAHDSYSILRDYTTIKVSPT